MCACVCVCVHVYECVSVCLLSHDILAGVFACVFTRAHVCVCVALSRSLSFSVVRAWLEGVSVYARACVCICFPPSLFYPHSLSVCVREKEYVCVCVCV